MNDHQSPEDLLSNLISRAKQLSAFFDENAIVKGQYYKLRVEETAKRIHLTLEEWHSRLPDKKYHPGVSKASISLAKNKLHKIISFSFTDRNLKNDAKIELLGALETDLEATEKLQNHIKRFISLESNPYEKTHPKNKLAGCIWNVFFLYFKDGEDNSEPFLGVGVLRIDSNDNVILSNPGLGGDTEYSGKYQANNNIASGYTMFDLDCDTENGHIHIKVYCRGPEQQILLGQYTTYEADRTHNGNILLRKISDSDSKIDPVSYSFTENHERYNNIDDRIINYLCLKSTSYHLTFKNVKDLDQLEAKLDEYHPRRHKESLFLERKQPGIFIAMPISANPHYSSEFRSKVTLSVQSVFSHLFVESNDKYEGFDLNGNPQVFENLKQIQTKRFFILVIDEASKLSYSYVQLGFAIAFCKYIFIVCKKEHISPTLSKMEDAKTLKFLYYEGKIQTAWEQIIDKLTNEVNQKLPPHLQSLLSKTKDVSAKNRGVPRNKKIK